MNPVPTPETEPYWNAARRGEFKIQYCRSCEKHYFYPGIFCRHCRSSEVEWRDVSGRAKLISYVIDHRIVPGFEGASPVVALVELDEGPRLLTNIVAVDPVPEKLKLDMPLLVSFFERGDAVLPVFIPEEN